MMKNETILCGSDEGLHNQERLSNLPKVQWRNAELSRQQQRAQMFEGKEDGKEIYHS